MSTGLCGIFTLTAGGRCARTVASPGADDYTWCLWLCRVWVITRKRLPWWLVIG